MMAQSRADVDDGRLSAEERRVLLQRVSILKLSDVTGAITAIVLRAPPLTTASMADAGRKPRQPHAQGRRATAVG